LINLNIKEKEEQIIPFRFPEKFLLIKEPNVREGYKNKVNSEENLEKDILPNIKIKQLIFQRKPTNFNQIVRD